MKFSPFLVVVTLCAATAAHAETTTVAVASNFVAAARDIVREFEAQTGHSVRLVPSSSGKLYAQALNGAPYDVFLSADEMRPRRLEENGRAVAGSRFTYAVGRLVLWSADPRFHGRDCVEALRTGDFNRLAIANPATAPYGVAAEQVLESLGSGRRQLRGQVAMGENIAQTLQFVVSGSANLGFVAAAQLRTDVLPPATCNWEVPAYLHQPLLQQAVLLVRGAENPAAVAFHAFLSGPVARELVVAHGYALPE